MPTLSVIILSYNTQETTKQCLDSLIKSLNGINCEIIVVDNGSTDGSVKVIQNLKLKIQNENVKFKVILNQKNLGYPKGNNQGLKIATGKYILFLNSDAIIKQVHFKQLFQYLDARNDVGVLTVRVTLPNGTLDKASHRGFPTIWNAFCYFFKLETVFRKIPLLNKIFGGYHLVYKDLNSIHEIDSPSGAFYLTRKTILDKVKGFDETFFMYGEDLDLSYRIKQLGYIVLYYPLDHVVHLKYASGLNKNCEETKKRIKESFYQAMKIFYQKHYHSKHPYLINKLIYILIDIKKFIS